MEMPGVTRAHLEQPNTITASAGMRAARRRISDYKVQDNTVSCNWRGKGEKPASGGTTMTFSRYACSGTDQKSMKPHGSPARNMTKDSAGRHLGPCR